MWHIFQRGKSGINIKVTFPSMERHANQMAGIGKHPIPDAWKEIQQRTSIFHRAGNCNASHPVNAILNYAYAVLQSQIQINAVAEGYDPTIGIMHEKRDGSAAFVFDLMEPERPATDRKVLEFIKGPVFDPADFVVRSDGLCPLNPELARCVVGFIASGKSTRAGPR